MRPPPTSSETSRGGSFCLDELLEPEHELELEPLPASWSRFLGRWRWDWFTTHTFRGDPAPEAADKRFRVWVSKLNRELFGHRWHRPSAPELELDEASRIRNVYRAHGVRGAVRWCRALELTKESVIHFHALIGSDSPEADVRAERRLGWMDTWAQLAGWARIEEPRCAQAVARYCGKYVAKGGELELGGPLSLGTLPAPGEARPLGVTAQGVRPCESL